MRKVLFVSIWLSAALLPAGDAVWKTKPPADWTEQDARQVLVASPWAREIRATITRRLTEEQLREGGQMGQPRGIGNDGVDDRSAPLRQSIALRLRWESALPIRLAELKSHEIEPPTSEGDGYRIAVYGIPGADFKGDPRQAGESLKNLAALKREGKRDVKPVSVEVFQTGAGLVVVYLFPLSAEIIRKDQRLQFEAHIGRIVFSQYFELNQMEFAGKLEL